MNEIKRRKFVIVIPARFKSSRSPGKPLANIKGKTNDLSCLEKMRKSS